MMTLKDFIVEALMDSKIYEMAINRDKYTDKIEDYFPQVVENICLIIYAKENKQSEQCIEHWLDELNSYILWLRERKVKVTKKRIFDDVIDSLNLYPSKIMKLVKNKFDKENFDIDKLSYDSQTKIVNFLEKSFSKICCETFSSDDKESWSEETRDMVIDEIEKVFDIELI